MTKDMAEKLEEASQIVYWRHGNKYTDEQLSAAIEFCKNAMIWHEDAEVRERARGIVYTAGGA